MPSFVCKFNKNYEVFLKHVYEYVIENFAKDFNLSLLNKIEIVPSLPCSSDGRIEGTNILLSKRLYDLLPTLDIDLLRDNNDFNLIVSTLYHELCHLNEQTILPNIHAICNRDDIDIDYFVAQFWIEYIVETKTNAVFKRNKSKFCDDIALNEWKINKADYDTQNTTNYFYLIKVLPYALAYCHNKKSDYVVRIKNPIVRNMIVELYDAISNIQDKYPVDDMNSLNEIKRIFLTYQKTFLE